MAPHWTIENLCPLGAKQDVHCLLPGTIIWGARKLYKNIRNINKRITYNHNLQPRTFKNTRRNRETHISFMPTE